MKKYILLLLTSLYALSISAQDIHYSQFFNTPIYLNPALTGVTSADMRFSSIYRSQWSSVPVPYQTLSAAFDQKIAHRILGEGWLGVGGIFTHDKAGDAGLSWDEIEVNVAYILPLTDEQYLSAGIKIGAAQRSFDPDLLTFGDQFTGDIFDNTHSSLQTFDNTSTAFFDFSAGLTWFYKKQASRTSLIIGASFSHLNQPGVGFDDNTEVNMPIRISLHGIARLEIADNLDIEINEIFQIINTENQEFLLTLGGRYYFNDKKGDKFNVGLAGGYRLGDAFVVYASMGYQNWKATFSYDINTSPFKVATFKRGGPEFSLQYLIFSVVPPTKFKACPIF